MSDEWGMGVQITEYSGMIKRNSEKTSVCMFNYYLYICIGILQARGRKSPLFCCLQPDMIRAEHISELIQEEIDKLGLFLVEVAVRPGNRIAVFVDSFEGVKIETCITLSRFIEASLDRDSEDFELEVSSPGLDNPLKLPVQFRKNLGRWLDVLKKDGIKVTGKLVMAGTESIRLESEVTEKLPGSKKKMITKKEFDIHFEDIKTAKVVISLKNQN
jgi:ribosome maturation factor RimP